VCALALVMALAIAAASLVGSSLQFLGTTSSSVSVSALDDGGQGGVAVVSRPPAVAALLFALALVVLTCASPNVPSTVARRCARAPPAR
jgi:hypothetical protein